MDQQAEKTEDRKSNRTRQMNKRGDSKVESNDSPEIPDRGRHQTSLASLLGAKSKTAVENREKMEETGCGIICNAQTAIAVKGYVVR